MYAKRTPPKARQHQIEYSYPGVIVVNSGEAILVDNADWPMLMNHTWSILQSGEGRKYARTTIKGGPVLMSRLLTACPDEKYVDHKNHLTLDNRRGNLRIVTHQQNMMNRSLRKGTKTSKYHGVYLDRGRSKWRARITVNSKTISLGMYDSEVDAALAFDAGARRLFGEFASLNFPDEREIAA